jgi:glycerophosphoryl diester phosphodiesterase
MVDRSGPPLVLGHRGASRAAPENTLEAFRLARELGADGVELDVRRTSDGVLVVHHDPAREGLGVLRALRLDEVRSACPDIPTVDEALDELSGMVVNLELKCLPWEPDADPEREVLAAVLDVIDRRSLADRVIVSSFDLGVVVDTRTRAPSLPAAWLTLGVPLADVLARAVDLGLQYVHPDHRASLIGGKQSIDAFAREGIAVNVWTVNEPDEMAALADAGVAGIVTDVPDVARAVITERRASARRART